MPSGGLLLASTSASRLRLIARLGVACCVVAPEVDEAAILGTGPDATALARAHAKAASVARLHPDAIVVGGDQLVDLDGQILGKPGSSEAAVAQLERLAGRAHRLVTALAVHSPAGPAEHVDVTVLRMRALPREALGRYVAHDRPEGCAGSYRIEGQGIALFERIEGNDPTAIEGLPLGALAAMLRPLGIEVP